MAFLVKPFFDTEMGILPPETGRGPRDEMERSALSRYSRPSLPTRCLRPAAAQRTALPRPSGTLRDEFPDDGSCRAGAEGGGIGRGDGRRVGTLGSVKSEAREWRGDEGTQRSREAPRGSRELLCVDSEDVEESG